MNTTPDPNLPSSLPSPESGRLPEPQTGAPLVIPVIAEQAFVQREVVTSGRVRLTKVVHEHEEPIDFTLQHDEVVVERVPVNQFVADDAGVPVARYEGDVMVVPVLREVVVKRLLIVEELRVTKKQVPTRQTQTVQLRQEEIRVDRLPGQDGNPTGAAPAANPAGPPSQA
jgi:uncharacterized protein (TIGR02271 family)